MTLSQLMTNAHKWTKQLIEFWPEMAAKGYRSVFAMVLREEWNAKNLYTRNNFAI